MSPTLRTPLCERLGMDVPVFGLAHSPEVVAAISNAGGFGVYAATRDTPEEIAGRVAHLRRLVGARPYGVDLLLPAGMPDLNDRAAAERAIPEAHRRFVAHLKAKYQVPEPTRPGFRSRFVRSQEVWDAQTEAVLASDCEMFACGTGTPPAVIARAKAAGKLTVALIGAPRHAQAALAAGVEVLVAQGTDAGGHTGSIGTMALVPQIVEAAGNVPVLAAGGIGTGSQLVAALAMGAQGVWLGTLWLATAEHALGEVPLRQLLDAGSADTVITRASSGKTMRQVRTAWSDEWAAAEAPAPLRMPYQDLLVGELVAGVDEHQVEPLMHQPAGQSVAWCRGRETVGQVIERLKGEAEASLARLQAPR